MKYIKVLNLSENHHGLQYQDGLNVDPIPFVKGGSCVPGDLFYDT
jgi:hypothetical protein